MAFTTFQTAVNPFASSVPFALEGDFCGANPRASMLSPEQQLVVGALPLTVGRFAWASPTGLVTNAGVVGGRLGFCSIRGQIETFAGFMVGQGYQIQPGYDVALFDSVDV